MRCALTSNYREPQGPALLLPVPRGRGVCTRAVYEPVREAWEGRAKTEAVRKGGFGSAVDDDRSLAGPGGGQPTRVHYRHDRGQPRAAKNSRNCGSRLRSETRKLVKGTSGSKNSYRRSERTIRSRRHVRGRTQRIFHAGRLRLLGRDGSFFFLGALRDTTGV